MHILITYATRAGSTADIAAVIGESLRLDGHEVDVLPISEQPDVSRYEAVLLGSAIRMGNWLPEAIAYTQRYQERLRQIPVALFSVHMLNGGDDEASRAARTSYVRAIHPLLPHAEVVYFTGNMELSRLTFADRLIARMVKARDEDRRDWEAIRAWRPAFLELDRQERA